MDGGWLCGSNGLQKAKEMIEDGIITTAIVGVTNLVLRPEIQFQYHGLNRLNKSVQTKTFSNDGKHYNFTLKINYELNFINTRYEHLSNEF